MDIPENQWLNADFLLKVLEGVEEKNNAIEIVSWKCEPAVLSGMNYLSQVSRVRVVYRVVENERTTSLIVKVPLPLGHEGRTLCDSFHGSKRELKMYTEVLPKMFQLHSWRGAPKGFPSPFSDIIVMEDLRELEYRLYPRGQLLDFQHCKEVLINLSTFHALSVSLHHQNPGMIESVGQDTRFSDDSTELEEFWRDHFGKFASLEECAEFALKIRRNIETFYPSAIEMFKVSNNLNVLTHDDLWLNNIMFRYDESGALVDSKLIDFQSPRYCSFAADLIVLWWSSVDPTVRELHQKELFEIYRQNLNEVLEELQCVERVSKDELESEVKRFAPYALRPVSECCRPNMLPTVLKQMDEFGVFS